MAARPAAPEATAAEKQRRGRCGRGATPARVGGRLAGPRCGTGGGEGPPGQTKSPPRVVRVTDRCLDVSRAIGVKFSDGVLVRQDEVGVILTEGDSD